MYVKTSIRKTRSGEVRYLQLAHNEWDAAKGRSVPRVIYGLGREDQLDQAAVRRLVASLSRLLEPGEGPVTGDGGLEFAESRPYGGAYVLDRLWQRLGIGTILAGLASPGRGRPRDAAAAERVLFGLVANRAIVPSLSSTSATTHSLEPTPAGGVESLKRPPATKPAGKPARRSAVTSMAVVVVFPCDPQTATSLLSRSTSASSSPRRTHGRPRAAAPANEGCESGIAEDRATRSHAAGRGPTSTEAAARSADTSGESASSSPDTRHPDRAR